MITIPYRLCSRYLLVFVWVGIIVPRVAIGILNRVIRILIPGVRLGVIGVIGLLIDITPIVPPITPRTASVLVFGFFDYVSIGVISRPLIPGITFVLVFIGIVPT